MKSRLIAFFACCSIAGHAFALSKPLDLEPPMPPHAAPLDLEPPMPPHAAPLDLEPPMPPHAAPLDLEPPMPPHAAPLVNRLSNGG